MVAMCTDFIDGAMARLRDQITLLGTYADPIADKLLVAAVLAWVGYTYLVVQIMLALIVIELVVSAVGARILVRTRTMRPSNKFGKAKMIVQSVALILFLVAGILDLSTLLTVSVWLLWFAFALLFVSGRFCRCAAWPGTGPSELQNSDRARRPETANYSVGVTSWAQSTSAAM